MLHDKGSKFKAQQTVVSRQLAVDRKSKKGSKDFVRLYCLLVLTANR